MTTINDIASSVLNDYYSSSLNKGSTTSTTNATSTTTTSSTTANTSYTNKTALGRYLSSAKNPEAKTIFEKLSLDVGGDGKSITKEQLDSAINSAKSGKTQMPKEQLDAMKDLQSNWKEISDGTDSVSYYDVAAAGYKDTLLSMVPETPDKPDYKKIAEDATTEAYNKIVSAALGGLNNNNNSGSSMQSLLNTLLTGTTDKNDDSNAELIAKLTNMLAERNNKSTVDVSA